MHRIASLLLVSTLSAAACGGQQEAPTPDFKDAVQYDFDFGGRSMSLGNGQAVLGFGGWTSDYACAYGSDPTRVAALRFDDTLVPYLEQGRDGDTTPPVTPAGGGVVLRVAPDGKGRFAVSLRLGGTTFTGTAPSDGSAIGFHHVGYVTPPELLAIEDLRLTGSDGSSLALSGTVSFPMDCNGI